MKETSKSVSERLSLLLGPRDPPAKSVVVPPPAPVPPARGSKLLRGNSATVFNNVNTLVDAVLQHILTDTTTVLNRLPEQAASSAQQARTEIVASDDNLPMSHAQEAREQLQDLEQTLRARYSERKPIADVQIETTLGAGCSLGVRFAPSQCGREYTPRVTALHALRGGSEPDQNRSPCVLPRPGAFSSSRSQRAAAYASSRLAERDDWDDWHPAALPLQRVREIEKYRTRFAQHCLASREAGIDRSDIGDAASVATWTIWPHLADGIALATIEMAIEEVHEALESHVEELVSQEVGGLH